MQAFRLISVSSFTAYINVVDSLYLLQCTYFLIYFQMFPLLSTLVVLSLFKDVSLAKYTEQQCIVACENTLRFRHLWLRRQCSSCVTDPPIGALLCSTAIRQPDNKYFKKIADTCVTQVKLTDTVCITACKDQTKLQFNEICEKCNQAPPMSADMCIFACGKTMGDEVNMYNVCFKCSVNPPRSVKLCRYACQRTLNNFYRGICSSSVCKALIQQ